MTYIKVCFLSVLVAILSYVTYVTFAPILPDREKGVQFYYQCNNDEIPEEVSVISPSKQLAKLGKQNHTLFAVIPGYTESTRRRWVKQVTTALLVSRPLSCVLLVEHWNLLSLSRPFMTRNVQEIARGVSNLLISVEENSALTFDDFHLVGFSLGSWVAGAVANFLPENKRIGRITGLDPSFPWHETSDKSEFLDSDDANVVVIVRTSRVSDRMPEGKLDFIINGGSLQPECDVWWHPDFRQQICSHHSAQPLFMKHLTEDESSFSCFPCNASEGYRRNAQINNSFGLNTRTNLHGTFCLETTKT